MHGTNWQIFIFLFDIHHTETIGFDLISRPHLDAPGHIIINMDVAAPTDGHIIGWRLYANQSGELTPQVTFIC